MITLNQSYTYEELLRNLQESGAQYPDFTVYKESQYCPNREISTGLFSFTPNIN